MTDIRTLLARCLIALFGLFCAASGAAQTLEVTMTAYSPDAAQTDATPTVTSTGEEVREGIVAVSRDLLGGVLPYGSELRVVDVREDERACGGWLPGQVLEVQDTLHPRKSKQIDLWVPDREQALAWGRCEVVVEVIGA